MVNYRFGNRGRMISARFIVVNRNSELLGVLLPIGRRGVPSDRSVPQLGSHLESGIDGGGIAIGVVDAYPKLDVQAGRAVPATPDEYPNCTIAQLATSPDFSHVAALTQGRTSEVAGELTKRRVGHAQV